MERSLRNEFGSDWLLVGDDLDNAIAEFGQYVEGRCRKAQFAYERSIAKANAQAARNYKPPKRGGGTPPQPMEPSEKRIGEIWQEQVALHVHEMLMMFVDVPGDSITTSAGRAILRKKATGDPMIDADWETADVETVYL